MTNTQNKPITKHTPGPWRRAGLNIASEAETVVASCYADSPDSVCVRPTSTDECLANARLIAAAPDLLAACKAAWLASPFNRDREFTRDNQDFDAAQRLLSAITKAEG